MARLTLPKKKLKRLANDYSHLIKYIYVYPRRYIKLYIILRRVFSNVTSTMRVEGFCFFKWRILFGKLKKIIRKFHDEYIYIEYIVHF